MNQRVSTLARWFGVGLVFGIGAGASAEPNPSCQPEWAHVGSPGGLWRVNDLELWDPDGDGPALPRILAAGDFSQTWQPRQLNGIASWNGRFWEPLGYDGNRTLWAVGQWDHDNDAHTPSRIIGAGRFADNWNIGKDRIKAWDGSQWTTLGDTDDFNSVLAIVQWDPDGAGPTPPRLVVGGYFASIEGVATSKLAMWDGANWTAIPNPWYVVSSLTTWDFDGAGPFPPRLVVGGYVLANGGTPASGIAAWDGSEWLSIGAGLDGGVDSVKVLDIDGPGPMEESLVAGGSFTASGGVPCLRIARWTGAEWAQVGTGLDYTVGALCGVDPDGPGPVPYHVFASLSGYGTVYGWDGANWHTLDQGLSSEVTDLVAADPDGDGPAGEQLIAGGWFYHVGSDESFPLAGTARWDGARWGNLGVGIYTEVTSTRRVEDLAVWDPDGAGPVEPRVIAGGRIDTAGFFHTRGLAQWTGHQWEPLSDPGLGGSFIQVTAMLPWPVHPAPGETQQLVIGGNFTSAAGVQAKNITTWDGESFHALAEGFLVAPTTLAGWDPDGPGPLPEYLVANYNTTIKVWNGAVWTKFPDPTTSGNGYELVAFDLDGSGPEPDSLLVAGLNLGVGRRWDWNTASWVPLPSPSGYPAFSVYRWLVSDPDDAGPLPSTMVAIASYKVTSTTSATAVLQWIDGGWQVVSQDDNFSTSGHDCGWWDPDGDGPAVRRLVAVGECIDRAANKRGTVAELDGDRWHLLLETPESATGVDLLCVAPLNAGAAGFPAGSLVAAGYPYPLSSVDGTFVVSLIPCPDAPSHCPGDVNGDGKTNVADFNILASNFASAVDPFTHGDLTGNGFVNVADFNILAGDFACLPE